MNKLKGIKKNELMHRTGKMSDLLNATQKKTPPTDC